MERTTRGSPMRRLVGRLGHSAVLGACLLALACEHSPGVPPTPTRAEPAPTPEPEPQPPQVNTAVIAGAYSLTVEFPTTCAAIPELSTPRTYRVTLEESAPSLYLSMTVTGGGYPTSTLVGDLWPYVNGNSARLTWNSFDIPGCDGTPEPLSAGRALMFCGEAFGTVEARTIRAHLIGNVFIDDAAGVRQTVCTGMQLFTFTRATP